MTTTPTPIATGDSNAVLGSAVLGTGRDAQVPWHYGDPLREQRRLVSGAGVVARGRDVLTVTGPERLSWLHSICSQHVAQLADGDTTEALVLSPHGHVEQHWQLTELAGTVWIDTEPGAAPQVLGYLTSMQFLKRVEPRDVSAGWTVLSVVGPTAAAVLVAAGVPVPDAPGRAVALGAGPVAGDGAGVVRRPAGALPDEFDLLVATADRDRVVDALLAAGAHPVGLWAYEALRIENRLPRLGLETDHRTIAHEVGWIGSAVHLDKGCYRGQETVARVQNLGRPPRRLVLVHFAGETDELPAAGTPVRLGTRDVGFLGTALHHFELGPIGLAVIKRNLADDAELTIGDQAARIASP